ncbi:MAG TPA: futalosine hydrolase [Sphingobacterium sp.]|jgi:futalosine hydrolase|nr:futalosine hydrolase [Sphingobacterium sp.]
MKILVVAATTAEISPSLRFLEQHQIDYLITGVGMVSCSYSLTKKLQSASFDLLIQVGIGGALDTSVPLGTVYQIEEDEIFEFGAEDREGFIDIEALGFGEKKFAGTPATLLPRFSTIDKVRGITVNKAHGRAESITRLRRVYPRMLVESMEGAAFFFVARCEQVAALQFRAISNYIEPRNREAWKIELAVKNLNTFLQELLLSLR